MKKLFLCLTILSASTIQCMKSTAGPVLNFFKRPEVCNSVPLNTLEDSLLILSLLKLQNEDPEPRPKKSQTKIGFPKKLIDKKKSLTKKKKNSGHYNERNKKGRFC